MEKTEVKVTGVGSRNVQTTIAIIRLGIEKQGETAAAALKLLALSVDSLVDYLKKENVDKLETSGVNLHEHHDQPQNPPPPVKNPNTTDNSKVTTVYKASNVVTFEVAVDKSGSIFDGAVEAGATRIDGISFKATPQVNAEAREHAIVDAVNNAKCEANIAAVAAGLTLGKATKINVTGNRSPLHKRFSKPYGMAASAAACTAVMPRQESISACVTITFEAE